MPTSYTLTEDAMRRTAAAVRKVEGGYQNQRPGRRRRNVSRGGGASIAVATLGATLTSGGSATATFTIGGSGTDTVYDALLCSGDTIASGTAVVVAKISGKWYVINAACPCV